MAASAARTAWHEPPSCVPSRDPPRAAVAELPATSSDRLSTDRFRAGSSPRRSPPGSS